jgi:hypothetical protein
MTSNSNKKTSNKKKNDKQQGNLGSYLPSMFDPPPAGMLHLQVAIVDAHECRQRPTMSPKNMLGTHPPKVLASCKLRAACKTQQQQKLTLNVENTM